MFQVLEPSRRAFPLVFYKVVVKIIAKGYISLGNGSGDNGLLDETSKDYPSAS